MSCKYPVSRNIVNLLILQYFYAIIHLFTNTISILSLKVNYMVFVAPFDESQYQAVFTQQINDKMYHSVLSEWNGTTEVLTQKSSKIVYHFLYCYIAQLYIYSYLIMWTDLDYYHTFYFCIHVLVIPIPSRGINVNVTP